MTGRLQLRGSAQHRARCAAMLCRTVADVSMRRVLRRPLCESWNLDMELGTELMKRQLLAAFEMTDIEEARSYLDCLAIRYSVLSKVSNTITIQDSFCGSWVIPPVVDSDTVILYLHGGGYSFAPRSYYDNFGAMIAMSACCRMFALDYRLSPEHRFPAQLEDAAHAYQWLLGQGIDAGQVVIAGDSAGGNLALSLVLALRETTIPPPALAVCLSPATDFEDKSNSRDAGVTPELDWITREMALKWADWYCPLEQRSNPLVSPVNADLKGLPPIYIQAGGSEILFGSIQDFAQRAKAQGADVVLDVWSAMNHDFQGFGYDVPQSAEAIRRIGEVVAARVSRRKEQVI